MKIIKIFLTVLTAVILPLTFTSATENLKKTFIKNEIQSFMDHFWQHPLPAISIDRPSDLDFFSYRDSIRQLIIKKAQKFKQEKSQIEVNDLPELLVDNQDKLIKNIYQLDKLELNDQQNHLHAALATQPWSDDYWAYYKGSLAYRYADSQMGLRYDWKDFFEYSQINPMEKYLDEGRIDQLSPAEKYDLLVGDPDKTLTQFSWNLGKQFFDQYQKVETWMGLCHGWAPASFMLTRPAQTVQVKSKDGLLIKFYPSDLKALATLLWAQSEYPIRFVGGRCNEKNPKRDSNGRIIDPDCYDTNPGTFHLALINQIGISRRSLIIDATYDYEVWNNPVISYSFVYFNPQTAKTSLKAVDSIIPISAFTQDKFKKYRSPQAKSVVGVQMKIIYSNETTPRQRASDSTQYDSTVQSTYYYDLEIDEGGNIIGGEWYQTKHPDFLWTPHPKAKAASPYEHLAVGEWPLTNLSLNFPAEWSAAAIRSSSLGIPLKKVLDELFRLTNVNTSSLNAVPFPYPLTTNLYLIEAFLKDLIIYSEKFNQDLRAVIDLQTRAAPFNLGESADFTQLSDVELTQLFNNPNYDLSHRDLLQLRINLFKEINRLNSLVKTIDQKINIENWESYEIRNLLNQLIRQHNELYPLIPRLKLGLLLENKFNQEISSTIKQITKLF